jgi:hypothetical protein
MLFTSSHHTDYGAFLAAAHVRLAATLFDPFHYVIDLFFGCTLRHIDDHDCSLSYDALLISLFAET